MKLRTGIASFAYPDGSGGVDLDAIARDGYSCVDYQPLAHTEGHIYNCGTAEFEAFFAAEKRRAEALGLSFYQAHGPWPVDDTTAELRAKNLADMKTAVRACALLGCENLVVHPVMPYAWAKEPDPTFAVRLNEEHMLSLAEYASGFGVCIAFENMPTMNHTIASVHSVVEFVKRLAHPNLAVCLDTGHANITGENVGDAVRECGSLLRVLHIHDNNGRSDQHTVPFCGGGSVDWSSFCSALRAVGYSGVVSLETGSDSDLPEPLRGTLRKAVFNIAEHLAQL